MILFLQTIELKKKCMKLWFANKSNNTDVTSWYPVLTSLMLAVARSSRQGWRRPAKRTPSLCITLLTLSSPRISSQLTEDTQIKTQSSVDETADIQWCKIWDEIGDMNMEYDRNMTHFDPIPSSSLQVWDKNLLRLTESLLEMLSYLVVRS